MARSRRSAGEGRDADGARTAGPDSLSFEAALGELEAVVTRLESGDLPLEQALEAFEAGVALSRRCGATLDAAERRIEILMAGRDDADVRIEPFEAVRAGAGEASGDQGDGDHGDGDEDFLEDDPDDPDR